MIKQSFLFVPMFYVSLVKNFVMDSLKLFPEKTVLKLFPEELRILNIHNIVPGRGYHTIWRKSPGLGGAARAAATWS